MSTLYHLAYVLLPLALVTGVGVFLHHVVSGMSAGLAR